MAGIDAGPTDLWQLIEHRALTTPDAEFLVDRQGRRVTFGQFRTQAAAAASGLDALGVAAGDVVAWELPTWIEAAVITAALHRLGTTQVPIIAIYRDREVTHCCRQTGARWLITPGMFRDFDLSAMGERVAAEIDLQHLVVARGVVPSGDPLRLPPLAPSTAEARWVFYTSGTTSEPKGARHSDEGLATVADRMVEALQLETSDRYSLVFPLPHVGGILLLFCALIAGCTHLLDDSFDPAATPRFLSDERVTHAGTGTPFHLAYLAAQRLQPDRALFPWLKCCPGGAAPKPPTLHEQVKRELGGVGIVSSWGLTEAPILTFSRFDDPEVKLATTEGRPLPGVEIRSVTPEGRLAAPDEEGELQVRGPQVMVGYVDSHLDAEVFVDGWLRTGDLGFVDEAGYVCITGRLKDVIIRNGENVSAKEVEDLLFTHPRVGDVSVIGVPDDRTGERVCAVVATPEGHPPITFAEMTTFLRECGLRRQAIPERLEHVETIPRNPAGKVTKRSLRDRFAAPA